LRGKRGIFASNAEPEQVVKFFEEFCEPEFARAGGIADRDVELKAGILEGQPFAIEPTLRQLGLQTKLEKGNIVLIKDTFLCKKGDVLKSEQARLLKLFGEKTANFQVVVIGVWADGKYEKLIDGNDDEFPDHHKAGSKRKKSAVNESDDEDDSDEDEDEEDDEEEDDDSDLEEFEE
jgi:mRNA turnover protein 4